MEGNQAKKQHAVLTDDDLEYPAGKDDEFLGRIQKKLGETKQEVIDWI